MTDDATNPEPTADAGIRRKPSWLTGRPLAVGDVVHGYAQGMFGRNHYACSRVEAIGPDWVVVRGVSAGRPAASTREDVVEILADARDWGRADWCLDSEGCGEDPTAGQAARDRAARDRV